MWFYFTHLGRTYDEDCTNCFAPGSSTGDRLPRAGGGYLAGARKAPACPAAQRIDKMVEGLTLTHAQKASLAAVKKEYGPKLTAAIEEAGRHDAGAEESRCGSS